MVNRNITYFNIFFFFSASSLREQGSYFGVGHLMLCLGETGAHVEAELADLKSKVKEGDGEKEDV